MLTYWIGRLWLWAFGWKIESETNIPRKCVLIAAPHTSNWDAVFMLAVAYTLRVRLSWFAKHTLFKPPWNGIMRKLGGIPVDRRSSQSLVMQMAEHFRQHDDLVLAIAPEGTRSKVELWKSGFYRIALTSGVPIGFGYLDFKRKVGGIGMFMTPGGNIREDMDKVRQFYGKIRGKFPEMECEPRLREEIEQAAPVEIVRES